MNSTLITDHCAKRKGLRFNQHKNMYPIVSINRGSPYTLSTLLEQYSPTKGSSPYTQLSLIYVSEFGFNFAYCNLPSERKLQPPWKALGLISVFSLTNWLLLILSVFMLSLVINLKNDTNSLHILFILLTLLFSQDAYIRAKSWLIIMWALLCVVLSNYYSADITCRTITTVDDQAITEISQLVEQNFTLVFRQQAELDYINATAQHYLSAMHHFTNIKTKSLISVGILLRKGVNVLTSLQGTQMQNILYLIKKLQQWITGTIYSLM